MITKKTTLPDKSILKETESSFDYVDSYSCEFSGIDNKTGFSEIGEAFLKSKPKWISALMTLRDKIVKPFGLKTSGKVTGEQIQDFKFQKGERLGVFKVYDIAENEMILGEDDKHLNFRISLFVEQQQNNPRKKNLTISSVVEFNNWFGRLYFLFVKPFHKLIVPTILKGTIKELEKRNVQHC